MKSFGQKKSNFMHGLKSAILAIFQKSADWLDWPCPVSAALQNHPQDFFFSFIFSFSFIFLNIKPLSVEMACLLERDTSSVIRISEFASWDLSWIESSLYSNDLCNMIQLFSPALFWTIIFWFLTFWHVNFVMF